MYMLQLNRTEENAIIDEVFGIWILDTLYNQYMLSLGEFSIDNFDDNPQTFLCYCIFLLATFITQITFLNMLIALMGDTFGRVIESKERFGLQTKLEIMGDYTAVILGKAEQNDKNIYMFVVTQKTDNSEDGTEAWEGNLAYIRKSVDRNILSLR